MKRRVNIAYLLIEESGREFDSRLLIAANLIALNVEVVIAPQWSVWEALGTLPRGVILFKGNNSAQARSMRLAHQYGFQVASIEEELLGVIDDREVRRIYDPLSAQFSDRFLVHGEKHAGALKTYFGAACPPVCIVGNPRIDLLRGQFGEPIRAAGKALADRLGRYILINTNFASINPRSSDSVGYLELCRSAGVTDPTNPTSMNDFFAWCGWEHENLRSIVALVHALRETAIPARIIIRPHPSENRTSWEKAFRDFEGVSVIREGDHLPWTAGASLLVHPGSTTGLEAAILGTPTINLSCYDNKWHDLYLATLVNPLFTDIDSAVHAIHDHLAGHRLIPAIRPNAGEALARNLHIEDGRQSAALVAGEIAVMASKFAAGPRPSGFGHQAHRASDASDRKIDRDTFALTNVQARYNTLAVGAELQADAHIEVVSGTWIRIQPRCNEPRGRTA